MMPGSRPRAGPVRPAVGPDGIVDADGDFRSIREGMAGSPDPQPDFCYVRIGLGQLPLE